MYIVHVHLTHECLNSSVNKCKSFMHTKRFNTFLKDGCNSVWVQCRMGAIPRL